MVNSKEETEEESEDAKDNEEAKPRVLQFLSKRERDITTHRECAISTEEENAPLSTGARNLVQSSAQPGAVCVPGIVDTTTTNNYNISPSVSNEENPNNPTAIDTIQNDEDVLHPQENDSNLIEATLVEDELAARPNIPRAEILPKSRYGPFIPTSQTSALLCFGIALLLAGVAVTGIVCGTGFCGSSDDRNEGLTYIAPEVEFPTPSPTVFATSTTTAILDAFQNSDSTFPPGLNTTTASLLFNSSLGLECYSNDDCSSDTFCSSLSRLCIPLTCQNWAYETPPGQLPYSELPCIAQGNKDGTAFCGRDGNCYSYNCENWYHFGPVDFTGYESTGQDELICNDYGVDSAENMYLNSVVYGCHPYSPGTRAPDELAHVLHFNQICWASPTLGDSFECYQNKQNTDYEQYVNASANLIQLACDQYTTQENVNVTEPLFWFQALMKRYRYGETTTYEQVNSLASFDAEQASQTMYSVYRLADEDYSSRANRKCRSWVGLLTGILVFAHLIRI